MDFDAIASALAARFAAAQVTPPAGYNNIVVSTANIPEELPRQPCVLVFLDTGDFETGNGTRIGGHNWLVRFYYSQETDMERHQVGLRKWATVLVDQLKTSVQLSGTVVVARVDGYTLGILNYAGQAYAGIELKIGVATSEGWAAVA